MTLVSCLFVTFISIKSAPVLSTSGDNFWEENWSEQILLKVYIIVHYFSLIIFSTVALTSFAMCFTSCAHYHIIVQIRTHSIINIDMVDNLTQTRIFTLLFPSSETLFAETSVSILELMSTENMPVRGITSAMDARENRLFPSFTAWCRISATLLKNQTKHGFIRCFLIGQNFLLGLCQQKEGCFSAKAVEEIYQLTVQMATLNEQHFFLPRKIF